MEKFLERKPWLEGTVFGPFCRELPVLVWRFRRSGFPPRSATSSFGWQGESTQWRCARHCLVLLSSVLLARSSWRGEARQGIHIERGVKSVLVTCLYVVNCYRNYFFFTMRSLYLRFFRIQSLFMFCNLTVVRLRFVLMRYHTFGRSERFLC